MKYSVITDSNVNLSPSLKEYGLIEINVSKFAKGRITYTLDKALNESDTVIYLTNQNSDLLEDIIYKELKIHDKSIILVEANSSSIGKNNLALKLLRSEDKISLLTSYHANFEEYISQDLLTIKSLSAY